jgi:ankyrin repeat protein
MADDRPPEIDDEILAFAARMFDLARSGETALLIEYVDAGLPVDLTNGVGDSLLMLAAYYDRAETVQALLERGADTGRINDRGQTALAAATFRRAADEVELLLRAGADPCLGSPNAIEVARFFEYPDMLEMLEAAVAGKPGDTADR